MLACLKSIPGALRLYARSPTNFFAGHRKRRPWFALEAIPCLASNVTSRGTTPNLGRPRSPLGFAKLLFKLPSWLNRRARNARNEQGLCGAREKCDFNLTVVGLHLTTNKGNIGAVCFECFACIGRLQTASVNEPMRVDIGIAQKRARGSLNDARLQLLWALRMLEP